MDKEKLWQTVLSQVQLTISSANFNTWFKNTSILSKEGGLIVIAVPNSFSKEWLEKKYNKDILKIIQNFNEKVKGIKYTVISPPAHKEIQRGQAEKTPINQLELEELSLDKETNLNPKYTFDNFIVGPFNELAHATAWAISNQPGKLYNPFFVYGGVGLGKTHLLQAIGNRIKDKFKKKKVKYLPSEKFISGIISSIRNQTIEQFKDSYRGFDVLIMDDIQFLAGKEKTQEEFFHLFNVLYENNKQIIISSDRPPKAISALEERLRSRFEGGMMADISAPDFESRAAILKQKSQEKKTLLNELIIEYIASNIQKNIRELEGALNRLIGWQELNNREIDIDTAKNLLKKIINPSPKRLNPQKIIKTVANFYNVNEKDLCLGSRKREVVKPRQVAMYLLRKETKSSFPFIGKKFGGRDHTTAIYACQKIAKAIDGGDELAEELDLIRDKLYSY